VVVGDSGIATLATKRLVIREFQTSDWRAMHVYASDPETVRYTEGPNSESDARRFVRHALKYRLSRPRTQYELAITLRETGEMIGHCDIEKRLQQPKIGIIGFILNKVHWNKGYGTEAVRALIEFGFTRLALHKISALCDPENIGSIRVLEKSGMKLEGHLKENFALRGRWTDEMLYSILEREWNPRLRVRPN
jgi:RimJ/RimL family protein N-acetyltransferase